MVLIFLILGCYIKLQKQVIISTSESAMYQMAEHLSAEIAEQIEYAYNSINLIAVNISQTMTSDTLENPAEIIAPMTDNTPFGAIEYIRADGMNVMNVGEPFDASDRVYYIEGIKGNSGIWTNYHPKTAKDNLINFYAPLFYNGKPCGVITGYIEAKAQLARIFESDIYGEDVYGLLIDENNMVICSTFDGEYIKDLSLEMFLEQYRISEEQKKKSLEVLGSEFDGTVSFRDKDGEGRVCVKTIPNTNWRVVFVVPGSSYEAIIGKNTRNSTIAVVLIGIILIMYATYVILYNIKKRKEVAFENARLEEENKAFDEANQRAFSQISEIRDIISSANMGTWRIELVENEEPRMYVDDTMKRLLGIEGEERTPEEIYNDWYGNITKEAVDSVLNSVSRMQEGYFDENTYKWKHPKKGIRYVRCGGTAKAIDGGFILRGYHYDVDEVVRKEKEQKKQQEKLIIKTQTDEMTGLLNRRAYEEGIYQLNDVPSEDNFTYISIDVNGLKIVNDTKGHMAGDELIIGACQCMKKALGQYGKLYRIGGDEFVATLFCDETELKAVLEKFDETVANWSGKLIDKLAVSYGWVNKSEFPNASTRKLAAIADERMYEAKTNYYRKRGVDRRGRQDAHKALCDLYTKILGINLTEDTYKIINADEGEQIEEKGFSDKISKWLADFGKSGQVHEDDLDEYLRLTDIEYLREYFKGGKTSLVVLYRRKYNDTFKKTMMEIIPANDYSDDYQSMFLYVKSIEVK